MFEGSRNTLGPTNLNCMSWYITGTVQEGPNSIERDSTNFAPLSGYSTISNLLQMYLYTRDTGLLPCASKIYSFSSFTLHTLSTSVEP